MPTDRGRDGIRGQGRCRRSAWHAIALLHTFIPTISRAYWVFTAVATQVYLIMYVLMFIAAVRLRRTHPDHPRGYTVHRLGLLCLLGGVSSVTALVIGFVPRRSSVTKARSCTRS